MQYTTILHTMTDSPLHENARGHWQMLEHPRPSRRLRDWRRATTQSSQATRKSDWPTGKMSCTGKDTPLGNREPTSAPLFPVE